MCGGSSPILWAVFSVFLRCLNEHNTSFGNLSKFWSFAFYIYFFTPLEKVLVNSCCHMVLTTQSLSIANKNKHFFPMHLQVGWASAGLGWLWLGWLCFVKQVD